jgi:hypothetical protein
MTPPCNPLITYRVVTLSPNGATPFIVNSANGQRGPYMRLVMDTVFT